RCLFFTLQRTTRSPLFPYTTLFRSGRTAHRIADKRFVSLEDLIARTGMQRDEVVTLADIGALNSFGYDRRAALWQAERAVRPSGALFDEGGAAMADDPGAIDPEADRDLAGAVDAVHGEEAAASTGDSDICPLKPMTEAERIVADYAGTGLTVG